MRIVGTVLIVTSCLCAGCAEKTTTPPTPGAQPGSPTSTSGAGGRGQPAGGSGAQAAAPLSAADLQTRMKSIASTSGTLRIKIMGNQLPDAAKDAQELARLFGDVERFWSQNNKADAVQWSQQARMYATEAAGAAAAGDGMKANAAASNMTATCKQCHGTYREGDAQTGYRIKAGVIAP